MQSESTPNADALIVQYFSMAERIARKIGRRAPWLLDQCVSVAHETLILVARNYVDQVRSGRKKIEDFEKYLSTSVGNAARRELAQQKKRNPWEWEGRSIHDEEGQLRFDVADKSSTDLEVGHEMETAELLERKDEMEAILTANERMVAEALRSGRAEEKTIKQIAEEIDKPVWWVLEKERSGKEKILMHLAQMGEV